MQQALQESLGQEEAASVAGIQLPARLPLVQWVRRSVPAMQGLSCQPERTCTCCMWGSTQHVGSDIKIANRTRQAQPPWPHAQGPKPL